MVHADTIYKYFRLIKNKDINRILDLFADDAIIYEPFSNIHEGLKGKSAINLEVVLMANDGLQHKIEIEHANNKNQVTMLVTFERGGSVQARFTFQLEEEAIEHRMNKIRSLHIVFS